MGDLLRHRRGAIARWRRTVAVLAAATMLATGAVVSTPATPAVAVVATPATPAVVGSDFLPGYIISDEQFYNAAALTSAQIQYFLDGKIGTCTNGNCLNVVSIPYPGRARDVSSKTGNLICEAIAGGTVSAAELIYRTQVACGISAKVILVTLQKEQSLVTSKAPSDRALRYAMGMACPDTAPCDSAFAGLGTQIVAGSRQLKIYKAGTFARQPGTHYIGLSPNGDCGGTNVTIRNYATAALYNYTPYQPNQAALSNLYSVGDGCSSYGNRNFWRFYNDWFGTSIGTSAPDAINSLYLVLGGASGPLGVVVESPACGTATFCVWVYEHGVISWTKYGGPVAATGAIGDAWVANRQVFGSPTSPETVVTDPNGNGLAQGFQRGVVHSSAAGTYLVASGTMLAYSAGGWLRGPLGWPTSGPLCGGTVGGCVQTFQGGVASIAAAGAGTFLRADVAAAYVAAGSQTGSLGFPISTQTTVVDPKGNGVVQAFDAGMIHASSRGAYAIPSNVMKAYSAAGWLRGILGWPIGAYTCDAIFCAQPFVGGTIRAAVDGTGAVVSVAVDPAVQNAYATAGGELGPLGFPISPATVIKDSKGNGVAQAFVGGVIHAGPSGAYPVPTAIMPTYSANGWLRGVLGWPTASAVCNTTGCSQQFAGGTILVPTGKAGFVIASVVSVAIRALYDTAGGATGAFGFPIASQTAVFDSNGNGLAQAFQNGIVHSSTAGTYFVPSAVMTLYSGRGWVRGSLGWPSGAAICDAGGCVQEFQRGSIDTHP